MHRNCRHSHSWLPRALSLQHFRFRVPLHPLLHDLSLSLSLSLPLLRLLVLRLLVLRLRLPPIPHHRTLSFFQSWYVGHVDPTYCKGFFGVFEKKEFYVWGSSLVLSMGSFYRRSFCFIGSSVSCVKFRVFALTWGFCFINPRFIFSCFCLTRKEEFVIRVVSIYLLR